MIHYFAMSLQKTLSVSYQVTTSAKSYNLYKTDHCSRQTDSKTDSIVTVTLESFFSSEVRVDLVLVYACHIVCGQVSHFLSLLQVIHSIINISKSCCYLDNTWNADLPCGQGLLNLLSSSIRLICFILINLQILLISR